MKTGCRLGNSRNIVNKITTKVLVRCKSCNVEQFAKRSNQDNNVAIDRTNDGIDFMCRSCRNKISKKDREAYAHRMRAYKIEQHKAKYSKNSDVGTKIFNSPYRSHDDTEKK